MEKEKREVIDKLMAYMRVHPSLTVSTDMQKFYSQCGIGKDVFKLKYVEESAALGFTIERKNNTPVKIVFKPPATTPVAAAPVAAPAPVVAPNAAFPAVSVTRQLQLLRQLKEYMLSHQLTEISVGELAPFFTRYNVSTDEFSVGYIAKYHVGLTLRNGHGANAVIVLQHQAPPPSSSTSVAAADSPASASASASALAALSVGLFPEDLLPEAKLVRQLREFMVSQRLTELAAGQLALFYRSCKIPKGVFSLRYIERFPNLGLTLKTVRGTGHVILLQTNAAPTLPPAARSTVAPTAVPAALAAAAAPVASTAPTAPGTGAAPTAPPAPAAPEPAPLPHSSVPPPSDDESLASSSSSSSSQDTDSTGSSLDEDSDDSDNDDDDDDDDSDVGTVYAHASPCLARYPVGTRLYLSFDADSRPIVSQAPLAPPAPSAPLPPDHTSREIDALLQMLPPLADRREQMTLQQMIHLPHATELVYDLGRPPVMRFQTAAFDADNGGGGGGGGSLRWTQPISSKAVSKDDIDHVLRALGGDERFSSDHRCGLDQTLHRISRRVNRQRTTIGFTMRIGRMVPGSTAMISDLIAARRSMLLIGCPGVGKTTLLRDLARVLSTASTADAVEIIDTSNEIAGEGDVPHVSIGNARRMMVRDRRLQHETMVEAVQNHMPTCLIIDEIGTKQEARAAMDVRHRGIQLIGTAHGTCLQQLVENPELNGLFGGIHTVILSDDEASRRGLRSKSVRERMGPCAFDVAIELAAVGTWVIHHDLADAVDRLLRNGGGGNGSGDTSGGGTSGGGRRQPRRQQQRQQQPAPLTYEVRRMRQDPSPQPSGQPPAMEMTVEVVYAVEPFRPPPITDGTDR